MRRIFVTLSLFAFVVVMSSCGRMEETARLSSVEASRPSDPNFFVLANGLNLQSKDIDIHKRLQTRKGLGLPFKDAKKYRELKENKSVYWMVTDIDTETIIAQGKNTDHVLEGASISKPLVAAAALDKNGGYLKKNSDWQDLFELLVESENNPYWDRIQGLAGGKAGVDAFTKRMGYKGTQASHYDNRVNAADLAKFLFDIFHGRFVGTEALFKVMSACNTGRDHNDEKSPKYTPSDIYMGGKTGTWNQYLHDMRFLLIGDKWYSIVILTEIPKNNRNENVAVLFGGLLREYILHSEL